MSLKAILALGHRMALVHTTIYNKLFTPPHIIIIIIPQDDTTTWE
jgi:hypothetical protein